MFPLDRYSFFHTFLSSFNNYSKRKVKSKKAGLNPKPGLGNYTKMAKKLIFKMRKDKIKKDGKILRKFNVFVFP